MSDIGAIRKRHKVDEREFERKRNIARLPYQQKALSYNYLHGMPEHRDRGALLAKVDALQAKIDMLMLEWCPEEMSEEQKANWERHQVRVSPEEQAEIEKVLEKLPQTWRKYSFDNPDALAIFSTNC